MFGVRLAVNTSRPTRSRGHAYRQQPQLWDGWLPTVRSCGHRVQLSDLQLPTVRSYRPLPYTVGMVWFQKCARCHRVRFWDERGPTVRSYRPEPYTVGRVWSRKCARCHRVQFWDGWVPTVRSRGQAPTTVYSSGTDRSLPCAVITRNRTRCRVRTPLRAPKPPENASKATAYHKKENNRA